MNCVVEKCVRDAVWQLDLCRAHYERKRRTGTTDGRLLPKGFCYQCDVPVENKKLYCSNRCTTRAMRNIDEFESKPCIVCEKPIYFRIGTRHKKYCSESCRSMKTKAWKYGLTLDELLKLLRESTGICAICNNERELVIDHCHLQGRIRALICSPCNLSLGLIEDSIETAKSMVRYLEHHSGG